MTKFVDPIWDSPLDTAKRLDKIPEERVTRGMAFQGIIKHVVQQGGDLEKLHLERKKYIPFKEYPITELVNLISRAAPVAYPDLPERIAVSKFGAASYHAITDSMAGKAIMMFANGFTGAMKVVTKIYTMVANSPVRVTQLEEGRAVIEFRNVWVFPESYHVGVFQEAMKAFQVDGEIKLHAHSMCDIDMELTWKSDAS